ncbi:CPBP family intramembrane glutamic endopeptidase [Bacillus sp. M6-12]|uniref:CPBP family intramembrane glutamic endopeptidase n=1 Tax=Bacillus sp. M6-12 TaxID=2054166 RepID=UPI0015E0BD83|nr:CPBP family intramembrane glutamic endopeptidase [Bacillus sp. M6-12]
MRIFGEDTIRLTHLRAILLAMFIFIILFNQLQRFSIGFAFMGISMLILPFLKEYDRYFIWMIVAFSLGDLAYLYCVKFTDFTSAGTAMKVVLNRLMLICYAVPVFVIMKSFKQQMSLGFTSPDWNLPVVAPWTVFRLRTLKLKHFLIWAITLTIVCFVPLLKNNIGNLQGNFLLAGLSFAFVNAFLEEFLWRGLLLYGFKEVIGVRWAVAATSLGFGLSHITLGFTLPFSLLFAISGLLYAVLAIKTKSILPSLIWHFVISLLMAWGGIIFLGY